MAARLACLLLIILGFGGSCWNLMKDDIEPPKMGHGEFVAGIAGDNGFTDWGNRDNFSHLGKSPHPEARFKKIKLREDFFMRVTFGVMFICIYSISVCIIAWLISNLIQIVRDGRRTKEEDVEVGLEEADLKNGIRKGQEN